MTKRLLVALVLVWASAAQAHKPSDSYLTLRADGPVLAAQWDIALRDLEYAIGLDGDGDGALSWGEVRARHDAIAAYALARLQIEADGAACTNGEAKHLLDDHSDTTYAVLRFPVACAHQPRAHRGGIFQYERRQETADGLPERQPFGDGWWWPGKNFGHDGRVVFRPRPGRLRADACGLKEQRRNQQAG